MFERFARKILKSQLEYKDSQIFSKDKEIEELDTQFKACRESNRNLLAERDRLQNQINFYNKRNKELEEENAVLRQYYSLDEPSQETKDKMYLDEKYRKMDKELTTLKTKIETTFACLSAACKPNYAYVPSGSYFSAYQPQNLYRQDVLTY